MQNEIKKCLRKDSSINAIFLLIHLVFTFLASQFAAPVLSNIITDENNLNFIATLIVYILIYPVLIPLEMFLFRKLTKDRKNLKLRDCFHKPQMPFWQIVKWIIISIGVTYCTGIISTILFFIIEMLSGVKFNTPAFSTEDNPINLITITTAASLFAPFFEELFFRCTLFRNVKQYGPWSMIIISGLTFGMWHVNYQQLLFASVFGMFSCFMFVKTKSIIPSMIVHFIVNSISTASNIIFAKLNAEDSSPTALAAAISNSSSIAPVLMISLTELFIFGVILAGVILMIIELIYHPESFRLENECPELSGSSKFFTYLCTPLMLVTFVLMIVYTVLRAITNI